MRFNLLLYLWVLRNRNLRRSLVLLNISILQFTAASSHSQEFDLIICSFQLFLEFFDKCFLF